MQARVRRVVLASPLKAVPELYQLFLGRFFDDDLGGIVYLLPGASVMQVETL